MEVIRRFRQTHAQTAQDPMGMDARWPRVWARQVRHTTQEAAILALPTDGTGLFTATGPSQAADGSPRHLWGVDIFGSAPL
jgi:hypothetical protein